MGSKEAQLNHHSFDFWSCMKMIMSICYGYKHVHRIIFGWEGTVFLFLHRQHVVSCGLVMDARASQPLKW